MLEGEVKMGNTELSTNVKHTTTRGLLLDYNSNLTCEDAKKRYRGKLTLIKLPTIFFAVFDLMSLFFHHHV